MKTISLAWILGVLPLIAQAAAPMAEIQAGSYRPLYLQKDTPMTFVDAFRMDKKPVTNREFYQFIMKNPQWSKTKIAIEFSEKQYLQHWIKQGSGYAPKAADLDKPVVNVSWFPANQYCQAQGKRLPSTDQWEYVARASENAIDGSKSKQYTQVILDWYAKSAQKPLGKVGQNKPNYWGVYDLHGLIWEWTEDFNNAQLQSDNPDEGMFCGAGASASTDPNNYAAFIRYGLRSSLQAKFSMPTLGFRCVSNKPK
ncbi:formylglycine-generating enzyme family protein [Stenoxybacter acetivorans]|uniref:formylglycine-generating enzyme family protein n=1 Tax=Stenoxybacter acetivorans TaxID=422441 RepID=UPI000565C973|nr:formylglycine-generating enzyme family protein [Stenoxybacter acetivorans]